MMDGLRVTKRQFVERMIECNKDDELPRVKSPSSDMIFFALQYTTLEKAGFIVVDKQRLSLLSEKERKLRKLLENRPNFEALNSNKVCPNIDCMECKFRDYGDACVETKAFEDWIAVLVGEFEGLSKIVGDNEK